MAYKVIILYQLYMPSYFLGTFTEYPYHSQIHTIRWPVHPDEYGDIVEAITAACGR